MIPVVNRGGTSRELPWLPLPQVTSTSLELHYWSLRPGLGSWVEGIVEGAAKLLHNLPHVDVKLLKGRADGTCDHEV